MLRLAHLSDLHFNAANARRVGSLLESIAAARFDHLMISGDLVASAHSSEFDGLRAMLDDYGYTHSDKLTIIPGNHDIFGVIYQTFSHPAAVIGGVRGPRSLLATANTLWKFRKRLTSYDTTAYHRDLAQFRSHFPHAFSGHITTDGHAYGFPFAKPLPNDVALIGVDSNHYLPKVTNLFRLARLAPSVIRSGDVSLIGENLSGSTGYVNTASLAALLEHPDVRHRRKILMMHHYLYPNQAIGDAMTAAVMKEMRLVNRDEVTQLIKAYQVELVLHGHWHVTNDYRAGGTRVLNGGGSLISGFNMIDVRPNQMRVTVGTTPGRVRT